MIGSVVSYVVSFILSGGLAPISFDEGDPGEWYKHYYRKCMNKAGFDI